MVFSKRNVLASVLNREYYPEKTCSSSILNQSYRSLIRKIYRRACRGGGRPVFKTRIRHSASDGNINPVYDLAYCPEAFPEHRVIAVADELGYLSLVNVPYERREEGTEVQNLGAITLSPCCGESNLDHSLQPVLYTLAWNRSGTRILTGYGDGTLKIWDLDDSSKPVCSVVIEAFEKSLKRVAWSSNDTVISCSRTNEIMVHDQRMRKLLVNRIDCTMIGAKLTDICVLTDNYVLASASNQADCHLFDLRFTYKLYNRIKPVESFNLSSPGYTSMCYDGYCDDGVVYALGSDSIVRSFEYRTGVTGASYKVPGGVDFFTKIDVDRFGGVLLSGSCGDSAWAFDLRDKIVEEGSPVEPFLRVYEHVPDNRFEEMEEDGDKENMVGSCDPDGIRSSCAVAIGTRRCAQDSFAQMACGGDNSAVLVYD